MENLEVIIKGCCEKNQINQQQFYNLYYNKMVCVSYQYVKNHHTAEDIVQESFIKAFESISSFTKNTPGALYSWLKRIVINCSIDHIRKNKKQKLIFNDDMERFTSPIKEWEIKELHKTNILKAELALKTLSKLSPQYRRVFTMYVLEGKSHKEIDEELKISVSSSKTNYMKAKRNLAKMLKLEYKEKDLI